VARARLGRPSGELREYLDLIDNRSQPIRIDWEKEIDEKRERGAKYGRKLLARSEWRSTLDRWNDWVAEYEELTGSTADTFPLHAALAAAAAVDGERGREVAEYLIENELALARYSDSLLDALVADEGNWPLVEAWKEHPSPRVRRAAARAVYRADERLARPVLTALIQDEDRSVAATAWQGAVYSRIDGPRSWRLDIALDALKTNDDPLPALNQLLVVVRRRAPTEKPRRLTTGQWQAIREIVLKTATDDGVSSPRHLGMALEALGRWGLDLALEWLAARLDHMRRCDHQRRYLHPLPDELGPLIHASRRRTAGKAELVRLLGEAEKPSTTGMYCFGVDQAIRWLGGDSAIVTSKIGEWIRGGPRLRRLALSFVTSSAWKVFTTRAKIVLDARPDDPDIAGVLTRGRYPGSWIGSTEPYFLAQAEAFRRWTRSRDARLRALGTTAIANYEHLAAEAAQRERREQESF
jgi:hypothetical protein